LQEAERRFERAVELDSSSGERFFDLGNIKFGLEKHAEALANYAKAEQLGCDNEIMQKLYYQIGILNQFSNNTKSALTNFDKAEDTGYFSWQAV